MSNLPEIPVDKYIARYKTLSNDLQDKLFKTESLAEALLAERDEAVAKVKELEEQLTELKPETTPAKGTEKKS